MTDLQLTALMEWARSAARLEITAITCSAATILWAEQQERRKAAELYRHFEMKEGPLGWPVKVEGK
jgi:hypothetical protein